jgi:carbon-monoxide dehydrogenase large subunit
MGIGLSFTEGVGAGPRKHMDILGLGMADGAELRVHRRARPWYGYRSNPGSRARDDIAQIVSEITGIPSDDIDVVHGTPTTRRSGWAPGSRSTPVSGARWPLLRSVVDKAKIIAAAMMEVSPDDIEVDKGTFSIKGDPTMSKTIQEVALAAHGSMELPEGVEGHLDAACVYDPPNLTYPYGAYICVVDVDAGTGAVKVRRFIAVDDCGTRINPMIVEGQIHGGLADGIAWR